MIYFYKNTPTSETISDKNILKNSLWIALSGLRYANLCLR